MNTHVVEESEVATARYFATVSNGKIAVVCDASPPQELESCQFELTADEFRLLEAVRGKFSPDEIIKLAKAIKAKIEINGK